METKTRTLVKSVTWRIISIINGVLSAYFFLGTWGASISISLLANLIGFILYFIHERIWNKIEWHRSPK